FLSGGFVTIAGNTHNHFAVFSNPCKAKPVYSSVLYGCAGSSVMLYANKGTNYTYKWMMGSSVITGESGSTYKATAPGNYRFIIRNSQHNCTDTSAVQNVNILPKPVTANISGRTNVHIDTSTTYSVINTTGSTYNWNIKGGTKVSGGNTNSILVDWDSIAYGQVSVIETNSSGCKGDTVKLTMSSILPVEWLSFNANLQQQDVLLNWQTGSEQNNHTFEIQRSLNNQTFSTIAEVKGNGTTTKVSNYNHTDFNAADLFTQTPTLYYRLKQLDFDGNYVYSKTVSVTSTKERNSTQFIIYPNPSSNSITLTGLRDAAVVCDVLGNQIIQINGDGVLDISALKQGVYFIRSGRQVQKFVKY
ncbi:MAG: T9SS type A sorting domain-containing protein, partial [Bacteroidota bacterium]